MNDKDKIILLTAALQRLCNASVEYDDDSKNKHEVVLKELWSAQDQAWATLSATGSN